MTSPRKRLLFFARPFPPAPWVASVRTFNMAIQLQLAGWQVDVVTLDPSLLPCSGGNRDVERARAAGVKIRYTGYRWALFSGAILSPGAKRWPLISRAAMAAMRILGIDDGFGWVQPALAACQDLQPGDVDVVLASGSPFFSFGIARRAAKRLQCPYVLDYRDLWNLSPHRTPFRPQRLLERRWLKDASKVLFVSRGCLEQMAQWTNVADKACVVTNGFDPADFTGIARSPGDRPTIVYAGRFYPPESTPTPILAALQRLQRERAEGPQFHYFGPHNDLVAAEAERLGVLPAVTLHGMAERPVVLKAIKQACAAVVITTIRATGTLADQGIVTAKLFEPLGLRTPVLLIAPQQSDARMILEDANGGRAFTGDDVDGIAAFLARVCKGQERFSFARVDRYSWGAIGNRLSRTLEGVGSTPMSQTVCDLPSNRVNHRP